MLETDHYASLGIKPSATATEIKRAYRLLARKYHPDVSSALDAEERFKQINKAYKVLSSTVERSNYDFRYRTSARSYTSPSTKRTARESGNASPRQDDPNSNARRARNDQARPNPRKARKAKPKRPWWNPDIRGWWVKMQVHWENANPAMKWFAAGMLALVLVINLLAIIPIFFNTDTDSIPVAVISYPRAPLFGR